jgi:hypothetical protein
MASMASKPAIMWHQPSAENNHLKAGVWRIISIYRRSSNKTAKTMAGGMA